MTYSRYTNETDDQLIYRICKNKDKIGTWKQVCDILNTLLEQDFDESAYRKKFQSFEKVFNANDEIFLSDEKTIEEYRLAKEELEKEKIKISDERTELRRLYREQARKESFVDVVKRAMLSTIEPLNYIPTVTTQSDNDLIVHLTDLHTGIEIDNYVNTFNSDVLRDRLKNYLDKVLEIKNRHNSENCYLIIGEVVSGLIHNNLRIENNLDLVQQFKLIAKLISEFIQVLSQNFNQVKVYVTMGNHSRIVAKKEDNLIGENVDLLLPFYLDASCQLLRNVYVCQDNKNTIDIAEFDVRGNCVMSAHGDKDSPKSCVQKWTMMFGHKPDLVYLGHRHTNAFETVYDTKVIQSGCISGTDTYALDHRLINKPEQTVSVITNKGLECLYDITL